jgi:hypothetical protein
LNLDRNPLTNVKSLVRLTKLRELNLIDASELTRLQISELKYALPTCRIFSNATK